MPPILPLIGYVAAMSISPGPVNIMCANYGNQYGFVKTQQFVLGAFLGLLSLVTCLGLGLAEIAEHFPGFFKVFKVIGGLYLVYLGYKIATTRPNMTGGKVGTPTLKKGFIMQWANPKAWVGAMIGVSSFASGSDLDLLVFGSIYGASTWVGISLWSFLGERISKLLSSTKQQLAFNCSLGAALVITAMYVIIG